MKTLPARLYICPACNYSNPYRWVLVNHLVNVHDLSKKNATQVASASEFLANPRYYRVIDDVEEDDD